MEDMRIMEKGGRLEEEMRTKQEKEGQRGRILERGQGRKGDRQASAFQPVPKPLDSNIHRFALKKINKK